MARQENVIWRLTKRGFEDAHMEGDDVVATSRHGVLMRIPWTEYPHHASPMGDEAGADYFHRLLKRKPKVRPLCQTCGSELSEYDNTVGAPPVFCPNIYCLAKPGNDPSEFTAHEGDS